MGFESIVLPKKAWSPKPSVVGLTHTCFAEATGRLASVAECLF